MEIFGFRILWQELTFEFWYRFQKFDWQHQHIIITLQKLITCTHYQFYLKFESCTASSSKYEFFFYYSLKLMYDHILLLSSKLLLYFVPNFDWVSTKVETRHAWQPNFTNSILASEVQALGFLFARRVNRHKVEILFSKFLYTHDLPTQVSIQKVILTF